MVTAADTDDSKTDSAEHVLFFEELPYAKIYPDRDVVIFDGDCNFCLSQVRKLKWADGRSNRLSYVSLHDPFVSEQYPDLQHDDLMEEMYLVDTSGNRYGGAKAFRYLSRRIPLLWILAPILHIPFSLPLWKLMYRFIAKHRYKLAGKNSAEQCEGGTCEVHLR